MLLFAPTSRKSSATKAAACERHAIASTTRPATTAGTHRVEQRVHRGAMVEPLEATRSRGNRARTRRPRRSRSPCAPMSAPLRGGHRARRGGRLRRRARPRPSAVMPSRSCGSTSIAAPPVTSGSDDRSAATTGSPKRIASTGGSPNDSHSDRCSKQQRGAVEPRELLGSDRPEELARRRRRPAAPRAARARRAKPRQSPPAIASVSSGRCGRRRA